MAGTVLQPPSPSQIREELQEVVVRDLLGPAGGPEEEIDESTVRDRYLVGLLAPRRQLITPSEFDDLAVGGDESAEEGTTDVGAPQTTTMSPSSFGMTFSVDPGVVALVVTARWGSYDRVASHALKTPAGEPKQVWRRRQIEETSAPIPLQPGPFKWTPRPEFPDVTVQGLVRQQEHQWIVTIFLVNGQEEPKQLRDRGWLFQPELAVAEPRGAAVFRRRVQPRDPARVDLEDRAMAMIYRKHSHPARAPYPPAKTIPVNPVRPPDLIIQDELHLISGPLGTLVGLYETAVDRLATWEVDGKLVRPKVIASTATIRRAPDQVHALFVRRVRVFPPHGLDVEDDFFSRQRPIGEASPGRRYIGICAPGRRLKATLIRVYVALLGASQQLYEKYGRGVDPWMTLVGYFNAMRELGGMRRLVDDDVRTRLMRANLRGLAVRSLSYDSVDELTSRKGGTDIPDVLDSLEAVFDPAVKGNPGRKPLDVLLATNMLSVGVDVRRLGLMVVAGQPKTTAEYIQATSRVGRAWPGLVCTVLNWVRPRDLSHYERFEHYHATFYKHVEALSVTPFAPRAIDRGLTALLVACIRLRGMEFNLNAKAGGIDRRHPYVRAAVEEIVRRAHLVGAGAAIEQLVRAELEKRLDEWLARAQQMTGGQRLGYRDVRDGVTVPLLRRAGRDPWTDFTCLNSLRDVEPEVGLVLDDRGLDDEAASVPVSPPEANTESTP